MVAGYFGYNGLAFVLPGNNVTPQPKPLFIYSSQIAASVGFSLYALSFILSTKLKWL